MYTLRPFENTDADYDAIINIRNLVYPDSPLTRDTFRYEDNLRNTALPYFRDVIIHDGEIMGWGAYQQNEILRQANKFSFSVLIHPEHEHQFDARQFYLDHVLTQLSDKKLTALSSTSREDRPYDLALLQANGFAQMMRFPVSYLDVKAFDSAQYEDRVNTVLDSGIEIITAVELEARHPADWQHLYYDLTNAIIRDIPSVNDFVPDPIEDFIEEIFDAPGYVAESHFIAVDGDQYVGLSTLWHNDAKPELLWTGMTGVLGSHRRRGIATILKIYGVNYAVEHGKDSIGTGNEENNPMYDLNMKLGFEPQPAHLEFEKSLS